MFKQSGNHCKKHKTTRNGRNISVIMRPFTLIELLMVIAILGILLAILFPALKLAKIAGERIICVSRMKQLGFFYTNYMDAYSYIPPGFQWMTTPSGNIPDTWYSLLGKNEGYVLRKPSMDKSYSLYIPPSLPKLGTIPIFMCKSGIMDLQRKGDFYFAENYFYNVQGYGSPISKYTSLTNVKNPSRKIALTEYTGCSGSQLSGSGSTTSAKDFSTVTYERSRDDYYYGRHNRTDNALFLDGHVITYPVQQLQNEKNNTTGNNLFDVATP